MVQVVYKESLLGKVKAFLTFVRARICWRRMFECLNVEPSAREASITLGGSCGIHEQVVGSSPLSTSQRSPLSALQRYNT